MEINIKPFRTIIFDLDGVIVNSIDVMKNVFEISYQKVVGDGKAPFEEFKKYLGQSLPHILQIMGLPKEMQEVFVSESYRQAFRIKPFPCIPEVLEKLSDKKINLGVATGKDGKRARSLLSQLGLGKYFKLVVGSDEVNQPKPSPEMIFSHLNYFSEEPDNALLVGDAVSDIKAGKAAAIFTAAATWSDVNIDELKSEKPDFIIPHPKDLLSLAGVN